MATTRPLTTIFTPPSSCFTSISYPYDGGGFRIGDDSNCIPPGEVSNDRSWAFSPAVNCPVSFVTAYNTAETLTNAAGSSTAVETRAICCPVASGLGTDFAPYIFTWNTDTTDFSWYRTLGCRLTVDRNISYTAFREGSSFPGIFTSSADALNAFSVQIAYQSSDLPSRQTSITSSGTGSVGTTSSTSATPTASQSGSPAQGSSSGLSPAATIAIAVVIPVVVLAALIGGFIFWKRNRRARRGPSGDYGPVSTRGAGILVEKEPGVEMR